MKKSFLLFLLFVFGAAEARATNYYVDKTNSRASNNNAGTNPQLPWETISRAAATLAAGDTVTVGPGGMYEEKITPANSGTRDSLITYIAAPGTKPTIRGFNLTNKSYVVISGFDITNIGVRSDASAAIVVTGSTGVRIINNSIHDTSAHAIRCNPNNDGAKCNGLIVRGNTMTNIGPAWNGSTGGRAPIIELWGDNSLIENNDMSHGDDFLRVYGDRNVYRGNTLHDSVEGETRGGAQHIDGFQSFCDGTKPAPQAANYLLVEGNSFRENPSLNTHFGLVNSTNTCGGSSTVIVRFNTIQNVGSTSYQSDTNHNIADNHKYYNNTTVNSGIGVNPKRSHLTAMLNGTTFASVVNNIFVDSIAVTPPAQVYLLDNSGTSNGHHNLAYMSTGRITWAAPMNTEDHSVLNRNPLFAGSGDFHLQPGSPAARAGGPLTTVSKNDTGSGTTLVLSDAHFFQPGWAGVDPDHIAVGSYMNTVEIRSINYRTNTVTLAGSITRKEGDKVWLYKNSSGAVVLYGPSPDIGAQQTDWNSAGRQ